MYTYILSGEAKFGRNHKKRLALGVDDQANSASCPKNRFLHIVQEQKCERMRLMHVLLLNAGRERA